MFWLRFSGTNQNSPIHGYFNGCLVSNPHTIPEYFENTARHGAVFCLCGVRFYLKEMWQQNIFVETQV